MVIKRFFVNTNGTLCVSGLMPEACSFLVCLRFSRCKKVRLGQRFCRFWIFSFFLLLVEGCSCLFFFSLFLFSILFFFFLFLFPILFFFFLFFYSLYYSYSFFIP